MPRKITSRQAREMARRRWARQRAREAEADARQEADGALRALEWINAMFGGPIAPTPAPLDNASALLGITNTLREVAPAVVLAAAELGLDRAAAERLGDLAALIAAETVLASASAGGVIADPDGIEVLPVPDAWRATVAWDRLYDPDGTSRVAGVMTAEGGEG